MLAHPLSDLQADAFYEPRLGFRCVALSCEPVSTNFHKDFSLVRATVRPTASQCVPRCCALEGPNHSLDHLVALLGSAVGAAFSFKRLPWDRASAAPASQSLQILPSPMPFTFTLRASLALSVMTNVFMVLSWSPPVSRAFVAHPFAKHSVCTRHVPGGFVVLSFLPRRWPHAENGRLG